MKIFAISGSPRKSKGITERILAPFLEGAKEAGAKVDLAYLQGKKIKPCLGCFHCWINTPGQCIQKDDVAELLELYRNSDVVVCATPLYVFGMTAQMKIFFDRFIPLAKPDIVLVDGHCSHPRRGEEGPDGMVVISSCGFHELDNFDEMMAHFKAIIRISKSKLYGALLRPHGEALPFAEQMIKDKTDDVYAAAREAGRSLVETGEISKDLEDRVAQELMPLDLFLKGANAHHKAEMKKAKAKSA